MAGLEPAMIPREGVEGRAREGEWIDARRAKSLLNARLCECDVTTY